MDAGIVQVLDAGTERLVVQVGCGPELEAEVAEESPESVRLQVTRGPSDGGPEPACLVSLAIDLASPLGERSLVNDTTGDRLTVRQVEELPQAVNT